MTLAWQVVRIWVQTQNDKRVPSLKGLLNPETQMQSREEQHAALMMLSQTYGGALVVREQRADGI